MMKKKKKENQNGKIDILGRDSSPRKSDDLRKEGGSRKGAMTQKPTTIKDRATPRKER